MRPEKEQIVELLKEVIDPELGVNIVDLGLVYDIRLDDQGRWVAVDMTLTTPGCPLGDVLFDGVRYMLHTYLPGVGVDVNLVWEPAWTEGRLTAEGRAALGR